jgi:hypothetical protein
MVSRFNFTLSVSIACTCAATASQSTGSGRLGPPGANHCPVAAKLAWTCAARAFQSTSSGSRGRATKVLASGAKSEICVLSPGSTPSGAKRGQRL